MKFGVIPTGPLNEATVYVSMSDIHQLEKLNLLKLWFSEPKIDDPYKLSC